MTRRGRSRSYTRIRDAILFVAGLAGILYETVWVNADRPELLLLFAGMVGLPTFLQVDESRKADERAIRDVIDDHSTVVRAPEQTVDPGNSTTPAHQFPVTPDARERRRLEIARLRLELLEKLQDEYEDDRPSEGAELMHTLAAAAGQIPQYQVPNLLRAATIAAWGVIVAFTASIFIYASKVQRLRRVYREAQGLTGPGLRLVWWHILAIGSTYCYVCCALSYKIIFYGVGTGWAPLIYPNLAAYVVGDLAVYIIWKLQRDRYRGLRFKVAAAQAENSSDE